MTRNERALKIAEYCLKIMPDHWIEKYSSFNGLMPIFCEINKGASGSNIVIIIDEIRITKGWDVVKVIEYDSDNPEILIDALQEAIIFYYENK